MASEAANGSVEEDRVLLVLDDPVLGLVPWIAFSFLPNITTFLVAALVSALLAGAIVGLSVVRGERPKALEVSDLALFIPLVVLALIGNTDIDNWFEDHADLVSNGGLTVLAVGSLIVARPFTAPYTEARFPGLDSRLQHRLDVVATSAWAIGLGVATAVTFFGEYELHNPDDLWTGWVFQVVPLILAYNASLWFDRRTVRRAAGNLRHEPSGWDLVEAVVVCAAPIGVLAIVFREAPTWIGVGLIALGLSLFLLAASFARRRHAVRANPWITEWDLETDDF